MLQTSQEGFRQERITHRQMSYLLTTIQDAQISQQHLYIPYIDFKNVFGSVNHHSLFAIMKALGFSQDMISMVQALYTNVFITFLGPYFGQTPSPNLKRNYTRGHSQSIFIHYLL